MNIVDEQTCVETARTVKGGCVVGRSTVRRSPSIKELAAALAKAQAELRNPPKDSVNPHFKSRYADLATVRDAVIPVLARHGLAVLQLPCEMDDAPSLTTLLMHTSGEWVETCVKLRPAKLDPQGIGSALTYHRRYDLQSLAGVAADDDDDGNAASQPARQQPQPAPRPASEAGPEKLNNLALRAKRAMELGACKDMAGLNAATEFIKDDDAKGVLTDEDKAALRKVREEMKARIAAGA